MNKRQTCFRNALTWIREQRDLEAQALAQKLAHDFDSLMRRYYNSTFYRLK